MELRPTRRIVTGHDSQGKATVVFDTALQAKQRSVGGNGMALLWVTGEFPIDAAGSSDRSQTQVGVPPPANGTVFRIVDFAPISPQSAPVDHEQFPLDGHRPGDARLCASRQYSPDKTIDYAIVLEGEIDMLLDDSAVHVKAGDVLVQQATNRAWVNSRTKPCRIASFLIDANAPPAWRKNWQPRE